MKSFSIVAIALCALVALCSSVPVVDEQQLLEAQLRFNIYDDLLKDLFSGIVQTTFGSVSNFLNQLIIQNPLGVGKRNAEEDSQARGIDFASFLYDNILQQLFSGLVSNTFNVVSNTLNNLITTNPLGVGKRNAEEDAEARGIDFASFLYDNILQQLFSGLVSNTFGVVSNTLNNLITTNPLGVGKRDAEDDLQARIDLATFFYDNILQQLFGGLVTNTLGTISNTLNNLITTNPLGVGKRAAGISIWSFLYDNIAADLFSGLVTNTANVLQSTLLNLINTNPLGVGKRSVNTQQAETIIVQTISTLVQRFKIFAHQAVRVWADKQQLTVLAKTAIAEFKVLIANLAQQLADLIPTAIAGQVDQVLGSLQSMLVFWTSGLGGSLGPVIGPFPH